MASTATAGDRVWLPADARQRLERRIGAALRRARRSGASLASVTVALDGTVDPTAVAAASRAGDEPWFCFEQPDRGGFALAGLGCVTALDAAGPDRFTDVARRWRELVRNAEADDLDAPSGSGVVAVGGFAFAPDGAAAPHWAGFPAASLHVPEVSLARHDDRCALTLCAIVAPDDGATAVLARLDARIAALRERALPLLDPDPVARARVSSAMPPEHYEAAVARAVDRIRAGAIDKVVLAREVDVHGAATLDGAAVVDVLRAAFPACFTFCVGRGPRTLIGASPELLVRREGLRASTMGLAGSIRRSADPSVDAHLGEQLLHSAKDRGEHEIVARRIVRALSPVSVWVTAAQEPVVIRVANIQHLATPIRAQLSRSIGAIELAGLLHPTPAVGGEPLAAAMPLIPALEGLDRGWYAGPVGWTDAGEDGELCVALRCALLDGPTARCYAGVGVVADSDPGAELAETEVKLQALLPLLAG